MSFDLKIGKIEKQFLAEKRHDDDSTQEIRNALLFDKVTDREIKEYKLIDISKLENWMASLLIYSFKVNISNEKCKRVSKNVFRYFHIQKL